MAGFLIMVRRFVIDTSLFVNPHARALLGKTSDKAATAFARRIAKLQAEFYMPPGVFRELRNFIRAGTAERLELYIKKKAPSMYTVYLPAAVFYTFVEDVRLRMNKGLRLAEHFAQDNRPENEEKLNKLREKYREAVRAGMVDSKEDFELILLAKELEGTLVTADEGVIEFANRVGCEWLHASRLYKMLKTLK